MSRLFMLILFSAIVTACCPTGTTVVLVPDPDGKVGKVSVTTKAGTTELAEANQSTGAVKLNESPTKPVPLSDKKIKDMFAETLASEPLPPEHFRFYFDSGKSDLLPEANAELASAKAAIDARKSCDLSVIGHSDRVGDNEMNRGLSIRRANTVATALTSLGLTDKCMDIRYYGENDPAVPTEDEVPEPRNRRVEVEIR